MGTRPGDSGPGRPGEHEADLHGTDLQQAGLHGAERHEADPHTLVGAYVLDAVSAADRDRFDEHLADCETCQAEVRGLREATARLAMAAAVRPRAELREQTVQAAARIRQLPPVTEKEREVPHDARRSRAGRRGWPAGFWRARAGHVRARPAEGGGTGAGRAGRWAGWRPRAWVAGVAAGVAVLALGAAAGMGAAMHGAEHRLDMAQDRSRDVAAVLAAPDATMVTAQVSSGGSATVVMSHRDGALVFSAAGLSGLDSSRVYELWLMSPSGPKSAGMLPPARHGMTGPMVVSGLSPGDKVGLTVEPAGGSSRPTTQPILMMSLS